MGAASKWAALHLSLEGRVHVAKQCLASKLVFQASFLPAPPQQLQAAQHAVRRFVVGSPTGEEGAQQRVLMPAEHVVALPKALGGMGYPILQYAANSLMAKQVAGLFSPGWQPWKRLLRHELAAADLEAGLPTWAVTLSPAPQAQRQHLLARVGLRARAYVEALAAVAPVRKALPPPGQPSWGFFSVLAEPLFYNARITLAGEGGAAGSRRLLQPADLPAAVRPQPGGGGWRHMRDVRAAAALAGQAHPAVAAGVQAVLAAIPQAWAAVIQQQDDPAPDWWCVAAADGCRYAWKGGATVGSPGDADWDPRGLRRADALGRLVAMVPPSWSGRPVAELPEDVRGLLAAAEALVVAARQSWRPAAVLPRPTPRPRWTAADLAAAEAALQQQVQEGGQQPPGPAQPAPPHELWLLGPWEEVELDPTAWAVGQHSLADYTARAGRARATLLAAQKAQPDKAAGGWAPKLWPDLLGAPEAAGGAQPLLQQLAAAEGRWVHSCAARVQAPPGRRVRLREAERAAAAAADARRAAPWLDLRRAQQRREQRQAARQARLPPPLPAGGVVAQVGGPAAGLGWEDSSDPLVVRAQPAGGEGLPGGLPHGEHPGAAWARLLANELVSRQHRVTAWRVLHGALLVNALRVHVRPAAPAVEGLCMLPECRAVGVGGGYPPWETLSHAFLTCPAAAPVVDWALSLWEALTPGAAQPPRCASVLLLDRRDHWRPPQYADAAWNALRVTLLGCLWHLRCSRGAAEGMPPTAASCAYRASAAVVEHLVEAINRDWLRVTEEVPLLSEDVCSSLFRGRRLGLSQAAFVGRWSMQGRLCAVRDDGSLVIRLALDRPVPIPGHLPVLV